MYYRPRATVLERPSYSNRLPSSQRNRPRATVPEQPSQSNYLRVIVEAAIRVTNLEQPSPIIPEIWFQSNRPRATDPGQPTQSNRPRATVLRTIAQATISDQLRATISHHSRESSQSNRPGATVSELPSNRRRGYWVWRRRRLSWRMEWIDGVLICRGLVVDAYKNQPLLQIVSCVKV